MSGFASHWLDLREPADHASRAAHLLDAAGEALSFRSDPLVVDLGCGTGSTFRAFAGRLPRTARWRLVDNDRALLDEARRRQGDADVEFVEADLRDIASLPLEGADFVTASALFDLVSGEWLGSFVEALSNRRAGLYAVLNYDGRMMFDDPHEEDERVVKAFNMHQHGDKGFGPALGPDSGRVLAQTLSAAGFQVSVAESAWHLVAEKLRDELLEGIADAVAETGLVDGNVLKSWLSFRLASSGGCIVGHDDVLALPARP